MLRRASRSLFVARNRILLLQSPRVVGKGATSPTIVGANQATQNVDLAGTQPLQFGKHEKDSAAFQKAAGAWDAMRKVGGANPIESNIERFEERYQTEGTGAEQTATGPSLWDRAKEAVQAVKESLTTKDAQQSNQHKNLPNENVVSATTHTEANVGGKTYAQRQTIIQDLHTQRPSFTDDVTGHRPWNYEMGQHSLRNSTDGMGIIAPFNPSAAEYAFNNHEQSSDDLNAQKQEVQQAWENTKQAAKENWEGAKKTAEINLGSAKDAAKDVASDTWQDAKQSAQRSWREATDAVNAKIDQTKESLAASTEVAKENMREKKEEMQQKWDDTKEVAKDGFREAGHQLKQGFVDIKETLMNVGHSGQQQHITRSPQDVEVINTRQEVVKGSSVEHDERNSQVPKKQPTRYGDWEYGGRASDF